MGAATRRANGRRWAELGAESGHLDTTGLNILQGRASNREWAAGWTERALELGWDGGRQLRINGWIEKEITQ